MLERIYISLWGVFLLAAGIVYISGFMTTGTLLVFGFVTFGLIFMGMIGILPFWTTHHEELNH